MSSAICIYGGSSRRTFRAISESLPEINVSVLIHPPVFAVCRAVHLWELTWKQCHMTLTLYKD
jgi:hypothetical protein